MPAVSDQHQQDAPYYCPGCGTRANFQKECTGAPGQPPHPPLEVVPTGELYDGSEPTAAPSTENLG